MREEDAFPAQPEEGYGLEKLYAEKLCQYYTEDYGLPTRVVRFHKVGGPEMLQVEKVEIPPPARNEVQISIKALGLNRAEAMFRSGQYLVPPKLPALMGYEAFGVVEAVGTYDPLKKPAELKLDAERIKHWLGVGAQPSDTVRSFISQQKIA